MKFDEKLMKLRKGKAMSQEELAEKLDVTRQTVSKWELGQTTPDMEKMTKIAEIFETTVNDLCDDNVDSDCIKSYKSGNKGENNNNLMIAILIVVLIFVLLGIGVFIVNRLIVKKALNTISSVTEDGGLIDKVMDFGEKVENRIEERSNDSGVTENYNTVIDMMDSIQNSDESEQITNKVKDAISSVNDAINEKQSSQSVYSFNHLFENLYYGSTMGSFMNNFIDEVIKSNSKNADNIITVSFDGTETSNADELRSMKNKFEKFTTYEIIYEYDANGFINKAIITL